MTAPLRYRALLIGNAWYRSMSSLNGPERDVETLHAALTNPTWGLFRPSAVTCMYGRSAHAIKTRMEKFFDSSAEHDVLLLFFAGHGENRDGELYLCTEKTNRRNIATEAVDGRFIKGLINARARAQRFVILLDCCESGLFRARLSFTELYGRGQFILTSTYGSGTSDDILEGGNTSPFSRYLAEALTGKAADGTGTVRFSAVARYVTSRVDEATGQEVGHSGAHSGDLLLARRGGLASLGDDEELVRPRRRTYAGGVRGGRSAPTLTPVAWPAPPSPEEAITALEEWASGQRMMPPRLVHAVPTVTPANVLRLRMTSLNERRVEKWVTTPSTRNPPPDQYIGPLVHAHTPLDEVGDGWAPGRYVGWRRGSEKIVSCGSCEDGRVACGACDGTGTTVARVDLVITTSERLYAPARVLPCGECRGRQLTHCDRCDGTGRLRTYLRGEVVQAIAHKTVDVPQLERTGARGPYRPLGTLDELDLSGVPADLRRKLDAAHGRQEAGKAWFRRRAKGELSLLAAAKIDFDDGYTMREAFLVGEGGTWRLHLPLRSQLAIRARQLLGRLRAAPAIARQRPVAAAVLAALLTLLAAAAAVAAMLLG